MDLRLKKYTLVQRIMGIEDEGVLKAITKMLDKKDSYDKEPISIEQYNEEIDAALQDYEANGGISHEEVGKAMGIGKYA